MQISLQFDEFFDRKISTLVIFLQTKHNMAWKDYKDKYGRCEVESAPFECKICGRVVKYDRNTVHTHLKNVHGINWAMYLDRIRRMRRGEIPEDLPAAQTHECRVCNVSVKYLKEHLKNAHKITEQEYESLFENDDQNGQFDMKSQAIGNVQFFMTILYTRWRC